MKTRGQIKEEAKKLIKTNNLFITIGVIALLLALPSISILFQQPLHLSSKTFSPGDYFAYSATTNVLSVFSGLFIGLFQVAVYGYLLDVLDKKIEIRQGFLNQLTDIIKSFKLSNFITVFSAGVIQFIFSFILIILSFIFFVVPPLFIIAIFISVFVSFVLNYSFYISIFISNRGNNGDTIYSIQKSRVLMNGNKLTLFIQHLSFIGLEILNIFTLGLLNIYIRPYMLAADTIFAKDILDKYEEEKIKVEIEPTIEVNK